MITSQQTSQTGTWAVHPTQRPCILGLGAWSTQVLAVNNWANLGKVSGVEQKGFVFMLRVFAGTLFGFVSRGTKGQPLIVVEWCVLSCSFRQILISIYSTDECIHTQMHECIGLEGLPLVALKFNALQGCMLIPWAMCSYLAGATGD